MFSIEILMCAHRQALCSFTYVMVLWRSCDVGKALFSRQDPYHLSTNTSSRPLILTSRTSIRSFLHTQPFSGKYFHILTTK